MVIKFFFSFLFLTSFLLSQEPQRIKNVFKVGIEFGDYLTEQNGGFRNEPGFSIGYLTGVNLYGQTQNLFILDIELNYVRIIDHRINVIHEFAYPNQFKYRYAHDERYRVSYIELGLLPEYLHHIDQKVFFGFYSGGSFGIGSEKLTTNQISRTFIDSTASNGSDYGPYGEYGKFPFRVITSFSIGVHLYYEFIMLDLRYKYTNMTNKQSFINGFNNAFFQVGVVI